MKKIAARSIALTIVLALLQSNPLHAQFLKKIINSVKQTTQDKADNKAGEATGNVLDSALQSKKENSSGSFVDTAATNKVLSAFAKAAQQNPNDTSAADVTMKALGLLTGGGGVSASDSAAAIKSFMTGKGGSGVVYQYITTITSKQKGTTKDTSTAYLTNSGYGRSEMRINMPGASTDMMISISHATQPQYTVMLYPDSKTYSLNVIDTSLINSGNETYKVTRVGNEVIQGYNCIHSKLTSSFNSRFLKSSSTFDIWTSTDVPGYSLMQKVMAVQNLKPDMMRALDQAGCGGSFVKMTTSDKDYAMDMTLIKAANRSFPVSLFEIPPGYTESKENMMYHMVSGSKK